jgi:hypothetical protein
MNMQSWIPEPVKPLLEQLNANPACTGRRRPVFKRLSTDPRMQSVFQQFFRLDRKTEHFLYAAKKRKDPQSREEAQLAALSEVLKITISAASDRMAVSKLNEILDAKRRWNDDASRLRIVAHDLAVAADFGMLGLNDPESLACATRDLRGLLQAANWLDHLALVVRRAGDPLVVKKHRGDPVVRAVQILIGIKLVEEFGQRLDGIAAPLTAVALGAEASPRASRSALTTKNARKSRSAR